MHTGGAVYFSRLIRAGYVNVLLAGNALAVHDAELQLFQEINSVSWRDTAPLVA